jgi:hypothetical protein
MAAWSLQRQLDNATDDFFIDGPRSRMSQLIQQVSRRLLAPNQANDGRLFKDAFSIVQAAGLSPNYVHDVRRSLPWVHAYLGRKQLSLHLVFEDASWTTSLPIQVDDNNNDFVKSKRRSEDFNLTSHFLGRVNKVEIAAHSSGQGICPPSILLGQVQELMDLLQNYSKITFALQYSHRVTAPYYSEEDMKEGLRIIYEMRQGSHHDLSDYVFEAFTELMRHLCQESYSAQVTEFVDTDWNMYPEFLHFSCPCGQTALCGGITRLLMGDFCPFL